MSGKVDPPHCDGYFHRWGYVVPIRCQGCGVRFADAQALEREIELRKRGYVERRNYWNE
jgi:hypothetical protein